MSHIRELEARTSSVSGALNGLGDDKDLRELLRHIHIDGYTTPAEFIFVRNTLGVIERQVTEIHALKAGLMKASGQILESASVRAAA
jgi:hypothetical protein